jgi:hypothetical protein
VLRIGNPGLQCSSGPCADASAHVNRRREATGRDAPIERRTRQGRHADYIPNSVERRNDAGLLVFFIVDPAARNHRRPSGEALPWLPRLRRHLRVGARLILPWLCVNPRRSVSRAIPSKRRPATAWPRRLRVFESRRIRHNSAITQRRRLVSRTRSWVHRSSCRGGSRSWIHRDTEVGILDVLEF